MKDRWHGPDPGRRETESHQEGDGCVKKLMVVALALMSVMVFASAALADARIIGP